MVILSWESLYNLESDPSCNLKIIERLGVYVWVRCRSLRKDGGAKVKKRSGGVGVEEASSIKILILGGK